jgi:DNA-binding MarR family transcriptional regulator
MPEDEVTTPEDLLSLDSQLCFALYSASLAMTKLYKPLLVPLGLTYPQYLVMMVLWESEDHTVNDLGKRLHLDSGTLTPLLKRMETAGLLLRQRDEVDERRVRVTLTASGRALKAQAQAIPQAIGCQLNMAHQDIADLRVTLTQLRQRLSQS